MAARGYKVEYLQMELSVLHKLKASRGALDEDSRRG
ncbi:unnamed protein product [Arabidopsis thaliana]|uniref:(thale cress) hypothetical protein n=1 Tax=Arabidopsis thaliana TaxID=3702 RepID=A0A7G2F6H1_ARATH|nr:unnamed protein product [Arabidopsis thaliana]